MTVTPLVPFFIAERAVWVCRTRWRNYQTGLGYGQTGTAFLPVVRHPGVDITFFIPDGSEEVIRARPGELWNELWNPK